MLQNIFTDLASRDSGWKFEGEDGGSVEIGIRAIARLGITVGAGRVKIKRVSDSAEFSLRYGRGGLAYGLSMVPFPVNGNLFIPIDQVSFGTIYKGSDRRTGGTLELDEIKGFFTWVDIAADFGPSYGLSIMFMNPVNPIIPVGIAAPVQFLTSAMLTAKAFAVFGSASATWIPGNVGVSLTSGYLGL